MVNEKSKKVVSHFLKLLKDPNRFQKLEDGWVRDKLVGVEWGPTADKTMTFKQAQDYCEKLGGRLPEDHELASLIDRSKEEPAIINKEMFPDTKSAWYWTSTQTAWRSDCAWCVGFYSGDVLATYKGSGGYVRPVRASQSLTF